MTSQPAVSHAQVLFPAVYCKTMITISVKEYNEISQDYYESIINSLQFHQLKCSCGHSACLTIHGYYKRGICLPDQVLKFKICRVLCSFCGHTHALLLSSFVPYSRIRAIDQHAIVIAYEDAEDPNSICETNPSIDENNVKSVILRYRRFWKERLFSEGIPLGQLASLIQDCFSFYSMQFMQIRRTLNSLFLCPT